MNEIKPKNRRIVTEKQAPLHPGQILLEAFLTPYGITQADLARHLDLAPQVVSDLVKGKRGVSPHLALLLGDAFGNGPEIWLNLQANYDLCKERDTLRSTGKMWRAKKLPAFAEA